MFPIPCLQPSAFPTISQCVILRLNISVTLSVCWVIRAQSWPYISSRPMSMTVKPSKSCHTLTEMLETPSFMSLHGHQLCPKWLSAFLPVHIENMQSFVSPTEQGPCGIHFVSFHPEWSLKGRRGLIPVLENIYYGKIKMTTIIQT